MCVRPREYDLQKYSVFKRIEPSAPLISLMAGTGAIHCAAAAMKYFFKCKHKLPRRDCAFRTSHRTNHLRDLRDTPMKMSIFLTPTQQHIGQSNFAGHFECAAGQACGLANLRMSVPQRNEVLENLRKTRVKRCKPEKRTDGGSAKRHTRRRAAPGPTANRAGHP